MKDSLGAVFDESGAYRYRLWRRWHPVLPSICIVMLNPSTTDDTMKDKAILRCIALAESWGYGGVEIVNLFAFRASRTRDLWQSADPVGPKNDEHIKRAAAHAGACLVAWGNLPPARIERSKSVLKLLSGRKLFCLGRTKLNQPRHPLFLLESNDIEESSLVSFEMPPPST